MAKKARQIAQAGRGGGGQGGGGGQAPAAPTAAAVAQQGQVAQADGGDGSQDGNQNGWAPSSGIGLPGQSPNAAGKAARAAGKQQGLRGPALRQSIQRARQGAKTAQGQQVAGELGLAPGAAGTIKNPRKYFSQVLKGYGPAYTKLAMLKTATGLLGYNQDQQAMEKQMSGLIDPNTGQPVVNYHPEVQGEEKAWESTAQAHIDPATGQVTGLTPQEKATYFASQADPVRAQAAQASQDEETREAQAGIDPRSGIAAGRAAGISAETARGLEAAGQATSAADVAQQNQWMNAAQAAGGLQQQTQATNVGADVSRTGQDITGATNLAELGENQRQFDVTYTEGQRQAQLQRQEAAKAAAAAKPSGLQIAGSVLGGVAGGLTGKS